MDWVESEHPRDGAGRFRDKAGGWLTSVSDTIGAASTGHTPARGRDLSDSADAPWDELSAIVASESGANFKEHEPDSALDRIYELQGYHDRPRVVSRQEMDELIEQGHVELWRGVAGSKGSIVQAEQRAEDFRYGDRHRAGRGIYGNGSYAGAWNIAREYTRFDRTSMPDGLTMEQEDALYFDPHSGVWAGLVRVALPPDARVIDFPEIRQWYRAQEALGLTPTRQTVLADPGRAASLRGYDAIRVPGDFGAGGHDDYYVLLNRSILVVQEAQT